MRVRRRLLSIKTREMAELLEKPLQVSEDHFLLKIKIPVKISHPGQFANIKIGHGTDPLIRRPFSIFDHKNNIIELIVKIVGRGTEYMRDHFLPGKIDVLAPLGKGFTLTENKNALLIGGGVGNAPLYYLAKKLKEKKNLINYLYAMKSGSFIYKKQDYIDITDKFYTTTDDGSEGDKGFAHDKAASLLAENRYDFIYSCGPEPMMKSIAGLAGKHKTPIEVSLERYFGCGIGLCSGCTVFTVSGQKRACVDGPVFDGSIINWEE